MNRVSRMLLIIGVMVLIGLSALYFTAKRVRTVVEEPPLATGDNPVPVPVTAGETAAEVTGMPEQPETAPAPVGELDEALQGNIAIFADARHSLWQVLAKYPKTRDSLLKELTDTVDTDRVRMYNYEMVEIRIARSRPLREAGMDEEVYKAIRAQYRAYRSGEGDLDPVYKAGFDSAPEDVMARADLKGFDLLDY